MFLCKNGIGAVERDLMNTMASSTLRLVQQHNKRTVFEGADVGDKDSGLTNSCVKTWSSTRLCNTELDHDGTEFLYQPVSWLQ